MAFENKKGTGRVISGYFQVLFIYLWNVGPTYTNSPVGGDNAPIWYAHTMVTHRHSNPKKKKCPADFGALCIRRIDLMIRRRRKCSGIWEDVSADVAACLQWLLLLVVMGGGGFFTHLRFLLAALFLSWAFRSRLKLNTVVRKRGTRECPQKSNLNKLLKLHQEITCTWNCCCHMRPSLEHYYASLHSVPAVFEQQQSSMQMQSAVVGVDSVSGAAGLPVPRFSRRFEILFECFCGWKHICTRVWVWHQYQ